jgi:hypothetical protein
MTEINIDVEQDLTAVTEQINKLVEELGKVNSARDNLIQQVQNLSGVSMYLRGKIPPTDAPASPGENKQEEVTEAFERSIEYPDDEIPTQQ